jgi:hypothetical protein
MRPKEVAMPSGSEGFEMAEFTSYDFSESVAQATGFDMGDIESAIAAWGQHGDDAEWTGGFLLKLKDGRFAYIEGWCDTTGWGCQDGVETTIFDQVPEQLEALPSEYYRSAEWETSVEDLNRLIRGEIKDFDHD